MFPFAALDRLKADLNALRPLSPEQEARVLQKFRLDWNYNSNAIEGNSLTLGETRSLLLHGLTAAGKPIRDHLDIRGHNEAVLWLEEIVRDERPLTEQFIRGMHEVLLGEAYEVPAQTPGGQPTRKLIHPGQYKSGPNNVLTVTGEMFYFATPEETPAKMTDLVDWYRREAEAAALHPVALAAEFHYRFVRIHPFDDGNGRMSRLLMNLILLRHGYPMTVIKATDRNQYLAALAAADAGEIEPFFQFIGENVATSLQLMIRAAKGESIDEPDDLDKKLALLKKQLPSYELLARAHWNLATQSSFYKAFFQFWINDLEKETRRFDDLFTDTIVFFEAQDFNKQYIPTGINSTFSETVSLAEKTFNIENKLIYKSVVEITWGKFRSVIYPFTQRAKFEFNFDKDNFKLLFSLAERTNNGYSYSSKQLLSSNYLDLPGHEQIHNLNHDVAEEIFEFISTRLTNNILPI